MCAKIREINFLIFLFSYFLCSYQEGLVKIFIRYFFFELVCDC